MVIAIDGPAGSGKSTTAKNVAEKLGVIHINTGAMYRGIALKCIQNDVNIDDTVQLNYLLAHTKLEFIGEGEQRNYLENLIDELGLRNKVFLLGFQKNPYNFLSNSDIFVLSSRWEGFGHVIVEAMATGTAVISTNCKSGPSEIIKNNHDGILCRPNNATDIKSFIVDLYKNKQKRKNLIVNEHGRKTFFEDKIIIKQYEQLFSEVI